MTRHLQPHLRARRAAQSFGHLGPAQPDGPLPVGADHAADGRSLVPANGRVDGAGGRLRAAYAHGPVFPGKAIRVEGAPQAVMDRAIRPARTPALSFVVAFIRFLSLLCRSKKLKRFVH